MKKRIIIFGAGQIGRMALLKYGNRVDYFIDNNENLWECKINGVDVKSVKEGIKDIDNRKVIIASRFQDMMEKQLKELGIDNYSFYLENSGAYYETEEFSKILSYKFRSM